jgi:hypothetical protein
MMINDNRGKPGANKGYGGNNDGNLGEGRGRVVMEGGYGDGKNIFHRNDEVTELSGEDHSSREREVIKGRKG